jgi:hypothetical protein
MLQPVDCPRVVLAGGLELPVNPARQQDVDPASAGLLETVSRPNNGADGRSTDTGSGARHRRDRAAAEIGNHRVRESDFIVTLQRELLNSRSRTLSFPNNIRSSWLWDL